MENLEEDELLILIGEKIEIKKLPDNKEDCTSTHCYDKFAGRYKVIKKICGNYNKNEITFLIDRYYDKPEFADYKNCLFYLSRKRNSKDTFTLLYNQFDDVYRTKDGEWASPFSNKNYMDYDSTKGNIKPRRIDYAENVTYNVKGFSRNRLNRHFPSPYFTINNKVATAQYGNYIEELVQMKKEGLLKLWGYFGLRDTSATKVKIQDVTLSDIISQKEIQINKPEVVKAAYIFFDILKKGDTAEIRKMSFDSVYCSICEEPPRFEYENNLESLDSFIVSVNTYLAFSQLWLEIQNKIYDVSVRSFDTYDRSVLPVNIDKPFVYKVTFTIIESLEGNRSEQKNDFEFVKVNGKYRFYGMKTQAMSYKRVRNY